MHGIIDRIAEELSVAPAQVEAAVSLLDEGATVPFIARYRKERTQGLDDTQLRHLETRLEYLRELESRRALVLETIRGQGKLTAELERQIVGAENKTRLEDLYLPYRPKRRTKAQIAREAGLEPLALMLLRDPVLSPETEARAFVDTQRGVDDTEAALAGARQILMERFAEDAELLGELRDRLWESGRLEASLVEGKGQKADKFRDYFDYSEAVGKIPSHRALALFRGRAEGVLKLTLVVGEDAADDSLYVSRIAASAGVQERGRAADGWLMSAVKWAWRVKIFTHLEMELKMRLKELAEREAIRVFGGNIHDLLLAAPAGGITIMGLDPGLRTGVKVAVVDATGKVLETATIHPHAPQKQWQRSLAILAELAARHGVKLISIGNGTASRETDRLALDLIKQHAELKLSKLVVSEAGASVYSASELASRELPELDVSLRGAVSIARRVQDPLAELVKIEPKAIGVGQYQHDVNQTNLARALDNVVEDCVNHVGVDVNTASVALLDRVAGLSRTQAENIVSHRDRNGPFASRGALLEVPRIGAKSFEQAAGFLRINGGENPLDASAVHPEAYPVVERILAHAGRSVASLIGDSRYLRSLRPEEFTDARFGVPTVSDIIAELDKPGRDPRGEFRTASFQEGVEKITDLQTDMILEGVVTNVTNFGAFVDIGVHQDGLVHISAMSEKFIKDPRELVKAGDLVKVKVLNVEAERNRIALSMRLSDRADDATAKHAGGGQRRAKGGNRPARAQQQREAERPQGAMAAALANAIKGR
ncbi:MAG: RNA-binding transcriptional accessory protein [Gammaproteobacteria bacterium]|nr:RNA-binding transcriptional accessory protein [Gammaproteobacteria bacterium]